MDDSIIRQAFSNKGFADAMRDDKVRSEMQSGMFQQIFGDKQARAFLQDAVNANIQANTRSASLNASLHNIQAVEARNALTRALADANLWKAISNPGLQQVMDRAEHAPGAVAR